MNFWRMVAIVLAVLWILPGRHYERKLEPAADVWPEVQKIITNHLQEPDSPSKRILVLSHMETQGGGVVQINGQPPYDPSKMVRYFFHVKRVWHWPWWNFPTGGGNYQWKHGAVVWFTEHITLDDVKAHGHLRWEDKK